MIPDPETLVPALRSTTGVKDVDIVKFSVRKELWVILEHPIDDERLRKAAEGSGYEVVRVGSFASRLPRSLAEMIWDGVTHVVTRHPHGWKRLWSALGSAPVAQIARNLATEEVVYKVNDSDGLKILQEYLKS
jgi:hypothetical protein